MGVVSSTESLEKADGIAQARERKLGLIRPEALPRVSFPHPPTAVCKAMRCPESSCRDAHLLYYAKLGRGYRSPEHWQHLLHDKLHKCYPDCPLANTGTLCLICRTGPRKVMAHTSRCDTLRKELLDAVECAYYSHPIPHSKTGADSHLRRFECHWVREHSATAPAAAAASASASLPLGKRNAQLNQQQRAGVLSGARLLLLQRELRAEKDASSQRDEKALPESIGGDDDVDEHFAVFSDCEDDDDADPTNPPDDTGVEYGGSMDYERYAVNSAYDPHSTSAIPDPEYDPVTNPTAGVNDGEEGDDELSHETYNLAVNYSTVNESLARTGEFKNAIEKKYTTTSSSNPDENSGLLTFFRSEFIESHRVLWTDYPGTKIHTASVADAIIKDRIMNVEPHISQMVVEFLQSRPFSPIPKANAKEPLALHVSISTDLPLRFAVTRMIRIHWILFILRQLKKGTRCGGTNRRTMQSQLQLFKQPGASSAPRRWTSLSNDLWVEILIPVVKATLWFHLGLHIPPTRLLGPLFELAPRTIRAIGDQTDSTLELEAQIAELRTKLLTLQKRRAMRTTEMLEARKRARFLVSQGVTTPAARVAVATAVQAVRDVEKAYDAIAAREGEIPLEIAAISLTLEKAYVEASMDKCDAKANAFIDSVAEFMYAHSNLNQGNERSLNISRPMGIAVNRGIQAASSNIGRATAKWFHAAMMESFTNLSLPSARPLLVNFETPLPVRPVLLQSVFGGAGHVIECEDDGLPPALTHSVIASASIARKRIIPRLSHTSPSSSSSAAAAAAGASVFPETASSMLVPFAEYKAAIQNSWSRFYRDFIDDLLRILFDSPYWKTKVIAPTYQRHTVPVVKTLAIGFRLLLECDQYTINPKTGVHLFLPGTPLATEQIAEVKRSNLTAAIPIMRAACPYLASESETDSCLYDLFDVPSTTVDNFKLHTDLHFVFSLAAVFGRTVRPVTTLVNLYRAEICDRARFPNVVSVLSRKAPPGNSGHPEVLVAALAKACLSDCRHIYTLWMQPDDGVLPRDKPSLVFCPKLSSLSEWGKITSHICARTLFILFVCAVPLRTRIEKMRHEFLLPWKWAIDTVIADLLNLCDKCRPAIEYS